MKYFFILGNHPVLSVVEIKAVLPQARLELVNPDVLLVDSLVKINTAELIAQLGGTIKIGEVVESIVYQPHALFLKSLSILKQADKIGKFNFGLSYYGRGKIDTKKIGLALKQALKQAGVSCRLVVSREKTLSSVVVEQNKLITSGRELVYAQKGKHMMIGVTKNVQLFKDLSNRDYGRPARDDYSGMLPPKLAQMMINIVQVKKEAILLDPFCGSGTVLTEAMMMGYKNIYGSDISQKAINDSQKNIEWLQKKYPHTHMPHLQVSDVRYLGSLLKNNSVGGIVSETYLGPQRGMIDIKKISAELSEFYNLVFQQLFLVLKPGAKAVVALPVFISKSGPVLLPFSFKPFKLIVIDQSVNTTGLTKRGTLLYGRSNQRVWREVVILEK